MIRFKFPLTAGVFVRRGIRRNLRALAFDCDLEMNLQEEKGFIDSLFLVTVWGSEHDVSRFRSLLKNQLQIFQES